MRKLFDKLFGFLNRLRDRRRMKKRLAEIKKQDPFIYD